MPGVSLYEKLTVVMATGSGLPRVDSQYERFLEEPMVQFFPRFGLNLVNPQPIKAARFFSEGII